MSLSIEDLQYTDDPEALFEDALAEVEREREEGEISDEEAADQKEQIDAVRAQYDEAGPPAWAGDADDKDNWAEQLG